MNTQPLHNRHIARHFARQIAVPANIQDYRAGWYLCHEGKSIYECTNDHQRDGWIASANAHEAMVKIGVRE